MISDSKYVKEIRSNEPKKGWKITWHDDKTINCFDKEMLSILKQAKEEERLVNYDIDKSGSYWNFIKVELAELPDVPETPSSPETPQEVKQAPSREHDIHKQVAYKGVMELCANGILPWEKRFELVLLDTQVLDGVLAPKKADEQTISIVNSMTK